MHRFVLYYFIKRFICYCQNLIKRERGHNAKRAAHLYQGIAMLRLTTQETNRLLTSLLETFILSSKPYDKMLQDRDRLCLSRSRLTFYQWDE